MATRTRPHLLIRCYLSTTTCRNVQLIRSFSLTTSKSANLPKSTFTKYPDPILYDPATIPTPLTLPDAPTSLLQVSTVPSHIRIPSVSVTLYTSPTFTPLSLHTYPATHLHLPLRRDILHRAVIYEADKSRAGTASTLYRTEVHGSGRKLRPQKGTGRARIGNKKAPHLKGGGVAHGPHPRDFSTELPKKLYDIAWRTALSYRYRRGELIVVHKMLDISEEVMGNMYPAAIAGMTEPFREEKVEEEQEVDGSVRVNITDTPMEITENGRVRVKGGWKKARHAEPDGTIKAKTTFTPQMVWVLNDPSEEHLRLFNNALKQHWPRDKIRTSQTVDVKNLLEGSRVVIEKDALDRILAEHQSDLKPRVDIAAAREQAEADKASLDAAVKELTKEARGLAITATITQLVANANVQVTESLTKAQAKVDTIKRRATRKKVHTVIEEV